MNKVKLDEIDHQILDILIDNMRTPFTDIAKKLLISAGTVHVRVKKMEDAGIIKGSSLTLDYKKLGYSFIAYIGIYLEKTHQTKYVLERLCKSTNQSWILAWWRSRWKHLCHHRYHTGNGSGTAQYCNSKLLS